MNHTHTDKLLESYTFLEIQNLVSSLRSFAGRHMESEIGALKKVFTGYLKTHPNAEAGDVLDQYSRLIVFLKEVKKNQCEVENLYYDIDLIQNAYDIKD